MRSRLNKTALDQQILEISRERDLRRKLNPSLVRCNIMLQVSADEHMRRIKAVYVTMKWVQDNAEAIKKAVQP